MKYICCSRCLDEKPLGVSMKKYERLSVSLIDDMKIRIWCNRHESEVATFTGGGWLWESRDGRVVGTENECWPQTTHGL